MTGRRATSRALRPLGWLALSLTVLGLVVATVLRTDIVLSQLDIDFSSLGSEAQAARWSDAVGDAHGARDAWLAHEEVVLNLRGELLFPPLRLMFGLPVTASVVELTLAFSPGTHGVYRYALRAGSDARSGVADTRGERDGLGLMLDSVRHLFEAHWTAETIPFRRGLPRGDDGLDGVFLTWGSDHRPTRDFDQVAMWTRNGRLVRMDTTGRDIAPFILAAVDYSGEVDLGSLRLPRTVTVWRADRSSMVHRWELLAVTGAPGDG